MIERSAMGLEENKAMRQKSAIVKIPDFDESWVILSICGLQKYTKEHVNLVREISGCKREHWNKLVAGDQVEIINYSEHERVYAVTKEGQGFCVYVNKKIIDVLAQPPNAPNV